jgi:hypothetical protein
MIPSGSGGNFYFYNPIGDEWGALASPSLSGTVTNGSGCVFVASAGPSGTLAGGNTTTSVVLSTALPAAVGVNQLANRGDGVQGFKIRIIGNGAGSSGKTSEALIIANTSGTTPTLTLGSTLSFTPASGDRYEILSGRVFLFPSSSGFKYYDIATNSYSGALTTTNLTFSSNEFIAVVLDEQFTPTTQPPGSGFFGTLTATGSAAGTLTGQASGGDSGVATNEYRNFQIRIVQDTTNTTAVGQRRRIASHTAGASPVYTLSSNWSVTPSATAQYVIEGNNDLLYLGQAGTTTFSYAAGGFAADAAWSTAAIAGGAGQYANKPVSTAAGAVAFWPFGITLDTAKNARYSFTYMFRGGGTTLDVLDIAAASQGSWSSAVTYANNSSNVISNFSFTVTGSCAAYDPVGNTGRYAYCAQVTNTLSTPEKHFRFDCLNRVLEPYGQYLYSWGGSGTVSGTRMAVLPFVDGATTFGVLYHLRMGGVEFEDIFTF